MSPRKTRAKMANPIASQAPRGTRRTVEVSCVAWLDLLGYGSMLRAACFDPTEPSAEAALRRLRAFHDVVAKHSGKYLATAVMNDGAAAFRDLSPRSHSVTYDFLRRAFKLFREINRLEQEAGFPGCRCVLAAGFRVRRESNPKMQMFGSIGNYLKKEVDESRMPINQAINQALAVRPFYDVVPELQANFAFAKAYLADSGGSAEGLPGPNFYLDLSIFEELIPSWLKLHDKTDWKTSGMSATFGNVAVIDSEEAGRCRFAGISNAFQVASRLSGASDIVSRLRRRRVTENKKPNKT